MHRRLAVVCHIRGYDAQQYFNQLRAYQHWHSVGILRGFRGAPDRTPLRASRLMYVCAAGTVELLLGQPKPPTEDPYMAGRAVGNQAWSIPLHPQAKAEPRFTGGCTSTTKKIFSLMDTASLAYLGDSVPHSSSKHKSTG